jgi:ribose transport system permease protein
MQKLLADYGMVFVLLALCAMFSVLTLTEQMPEGEDTVAALAEQIGHECRPTDLVLAVGAANKPSAALAENVGQALRNDGFVDVRTVIGIPRDLRQALDQIAAEGETVVALVTGGDAMKWRVVEQLGQEPPTENVRLFTLEPRLWPDFLKRTNLLAIVDRIVVIAVIAIGMTMVIITSGIDLSVGSLLAVSAVIGTLIMKRLGGLEASPWAVLAGFLVGVLTCGVIGAVGGLIVARFKVAPFITTLAVMMMGRGLAFLITGGFSIYQVPRSLPWLGQGSSLGIPNTVILLIVLYTAAHIFMSRTRLGRYIYAVGGNEEAARLSGVPVMFVTVFVYTVSAVAAGLGGCIQASQLNTGTPNMGVMYELYVIAAVVVGGTSLAGGSGRILGTLIGAFIISVIQNGMNLLGLESYTQQVVLGAVILGAVLLDKVRSGGGLRLRTK